MQIATGIWVSAFWATLPVFAYAIFAQKATWGYEKFSWLVVMSIIWGSMPAFAFMVIAPLVLLWGGESDLFHEANHLWLMTVFVPMAEEGLKTLSIIAMIAYLRRPTLTVVEGLLYGSLVGLGFSMVEDFWYYLSKLQEVGTTLPAEEMIARGLLGAFNHAVYSGLVGAGLGMANRSPRPAKWIWASLSFVGAIGLHSLYNFTAFISDDNFLSEFSVNFRMSAMVVNALISALGVCLFFALALGSWDEIKNVLLRNVAPEIKDPQLSQRIKDVRELNYPPFMTASKGSPTSKEVIALAVRKQLESRESRVD